MRKIDFDLEAGLEVEEILDDLATRSDMTRVLDTIVGVCIKTMIEAGVSRKRFEHNVEALWRQIEAKVADQVSYDAPVDDSTALTVEAALALCCKCGQVNCGTAKA